MSGFNRAAVSLVALLLIAGAVVTLLVILEAVDPDFLPGGSSSEAWFYDQLLGLSEFTGADQAVTVAVSIVVGLFALALFALEIRPLLPRTPESLQISAGDRGVSTVHVDSIRLLAERTGSTNRNVNSIRCRLRVTRRPAGGGPATVNIACYPRVQLGSDLPEIRDDLQLRVKEVVEQLTGLTVSRVHVARIKYDRNGDSRLLGV